jgi:oligosaccharide repeat unit polymerase
MKGRARIALDVLFSPITLALGVFVPLLLLFLITKPSVFESEFAVAKATNVTGLVYLSLSLLVFFFGALAGLRMAALPPRRADTFADDVDEPFLDLLTRGLRGALLLTIAAYVLWFGSGLVRAGGLSAFVHEWSTNPELVKSTILRTIPGVTTMTQLAVAAVPLAIAFGVHRRQGMTPLIATVVALALVRSFVFSERLALLELVVPLVYLGLGRRIVLVPRALLFAGASVLAVLVLFTATEARRSIVYTHNFSVTHMTARFFGYYLTSENNALVVADQYRAATPLMFTGEMFWNFPLVEKVHVENAPVLGTVSLRYEDVFGKDPATFWPSAFSDSGLSYEYNTFTTPGYLAGDLGWIGIAVVLLLGVYSGMLYKRARAHPFHRALYAMWLVGLLEFMRIIYFFNTRTLPAYVVFALVYLALVRRGNVLAWRATTGLPHTRRGRAISRAGSAPGHADRQPSPQE